MSREDGASSHPPTKSDARNNTRTRPVLSCVSWLPSLVGGLAPIRDSRADPRGGLHHQRLLHRMVLGLLQPKRRAAEGGGAVRRRQGAAHTARQEVRTQGEGLPLARARQDTPRPRAIVRSNEAGIYNSVTRVRIGICSPLTSFCRSGDGRARRTAHPATCFRNLAPLMKDLKRKTISILFTPKFSERTITFSARRRNH